MSVIDYADLNESERAEFYCALVYYAIRRYGAGVAALLFHTVP